MKLRWLLLLAAALNVAQGAPQENRGLQLPEQGMAEIGGVPFDSQKEDKPAGGDEEPTRRIRARTVKRRRRMRKRYRTTVEPPLEEPNEQLNVAEQNTDVAYEPRVVEEATALPPLEETTRKRQTKRRRRPHRKYQPDIQQENQGFIETDGGEGTPKPPRRRRKGGRRRMRPQVEATEPNKVELFVETTAMPPEPAEITTMSYVTEKVVEIVTTQATEPVSLESTEVNHPNGYQTHKYRNNLVSEPSVEQVVDGGDPQKSNAAILDDERTVVSPSNPSRLQPYSIKPAVNTIKPVREFVDEKESVPTEYYEERVNKETNEVPSIAPSDVSVSQPDYGNKVFDRKALFSKSRKLPETSAVIRKKLSPSTVSSISSKNETTEKQLIPDGFTVQPLTVEPSKLIERLKAHAKSYRTTTTATQTTIMTTEEPNYPKFESKKEKYSPTENIIRATTEIMHDRFNKVVELHRSRGKVVITKTEPENEPSEQTTTNAQIVELGTTETIKTDADGTVAEEQTTIIPENLNLSILNLHKLNDSIVEMLKTESGNMKLSEILESRNMTLAQLLDHRERGSSRFHLSDIFAEKKSLVGENSTASMNLDQEEVGTPLYVEKQTILFPNQDILGSFPSFISDKIHGVAQNTKDGTNELSTKKAVQLENREPRVFDSMPEFSNKNNANPPWKNINPKLRPVSVRGNYEEIKITLHPSENLKSENEIDNVFLAEDKADVLRTNRGASTLEAETITSRDTGFGRFRKIPVTVKSAIIISVAILILAIFGFLSVLISCRLRQKKARLRAKQDILCEHLKAEDFMNSQQSLSPVLTKHQQRGPVFSPSNTIHSNTTSNRHYYLWRTLRKTFQYD